MLTREQFKDLLAVKGTLVIDGGLATELENKGHDLNHLLWSAKLLEEDPTTIKQVHLDYYIAGADIAITGSYQSSTQGLITHLGVDDLRAEAIIKESVTLARAAREESYDPGVKRDTALLVAGSVGPYGAYLADGSEYRGDYQLSESEFKDFHRPRIRALVEGDVDLLAIETMPHLGEISAVLDLVHEEFPSTIAWLSCTLKDSSHISDGTTLEEVIEIVESYPDVVVALGINCIPTDLVTQALQHMRSRTDVPLVCYPNSGESWDANSNSWSGSNIARSNVEVNVSDWQTAGARLIGGCCRTGPEYVMNVLKTVERTVRLDRSHEKSCT